MWHSSACTNPLANEAKSHQWCGTKPSPISPTSDPTQKNRSPMSELGSNKSHLLTDKATRPPLLLSWQQSLPSVTENPTQHPSLGEARDMLKTANAYKSPDKARGSTTTNSARLCLKPMTGQSPALGWHNLPQAEPNSDGSLSRRSQPADGA